MWGWGAAALLLGSGAAIAAEPDEAARRFGTREAVQQISLSPDGNRVAVVLAVKGHGAALVVIPTDRPLAGPFRPIVKSGGYPDDLRGCQWTSDTRLTCTITVVRNDAVRIGFTRLIAINADGSGMKLLSSNPGDSALGIMQDGGTIIDWTADGRPGSVLMTRQFVGEQSTGTLMAASRTGLGVEAVDTANFARRTVELPRADAEEYISDGRGTVRIMGLRPRTGDGDLKDRITYLYRKHGSRDWLPLSKLEGGHGGFNPYAVDPVLDVAYGFDDKDGRRALFRMALDGSMKEELVLARPDVDVDGLIRIGRQHRVVGTSYAVERREPQLFDPELKRLAAGLNKALAGQHNLVFVDASADEGKLLLFVGSDTDPGRYYLYTKANHHLDEVMPVRPLLEGDKLAVVKPVTFKAADGTIIPAYLTLPPGSDGKNLPAIVMPHGGPGDRDEWGFDWLSQFYAARGFAVLQPEFRGSTGYGSAWFQRNGFQSWRTAIGDVNDAGRWLAAQGIAAPGKLAIVGWSYGGYAALQSAVLDPQLYKAIVAVAPVTDLETLRGEARGYTSARLVDTFIGHGDHVKAGSPAQNAGRIAAPVMIFHGDQDQNVDVGESRLMAARLRKAGKSVDYVEFKNLDHQLDDDEARTTLLERSDAFLRTALDVKG